MLGMVAITVCVTVCGKGCILYSQCMVMGHHCMSPYQVGQLALMVWSWIYIWQLYGLLWGWVQL